jgi:hypothetical protein
MENEPENFIFIFRKEKKWDSRARFFIAEMSQWAFPWPSVVATLIYEYWHGMELAALCTASKDFFSLADQLDTAFEENQFEKAALLFTECAIDEEMGEDYQDILCNKVGLKQVLTWIEHKQWDNLCDSLPMVAAYLEAEAKKLDEKKSVAMKFYWTAPSSS